MLDTKARLRSVRTPLRFQDVRGVIALCLLLPTILRIGWHEPVMPTTILWLMQLGLLGVYVVLFAIDYHRVRALDAPRRKDLLAILRPELIAVVLSIIFCWSWVGLALMTAPLAMIFGVRSFLRLAQTSIPSGLIFVGSFIMLTAVGAGLLMLPAAVPRNAPISGIDAVFTATSAISQTGLVVRPTGVVHDAAGNPVAGFTRFGQIIILVWIQVGALGVLVFGALVANLMGSGFGMRATQALAEVTEHGWEGQLSAQRLVTFVILVTHSIEFIGAVCIYFALPEAWAGMPHDLETTGDRIFHAVFLSVSAFCNAGFSTTTDSMESLRTHFLPHTIMVPLIVFGAMGYAVLENVWRVLKARLKKQRVMDGMLIRLSLHAKLVLASTLLAYLISVVLIIISELVQTTDPLHLIALDAHFMAINRTTGFNTVVVDEMGGLSRLTLIFGMWAGGAPGSVASGVKLIVISVLALTVWSTIRGRSETTAFGRTIPDDVIRKCATLAVVFWVLIMTSTAALVLTEDQIDHSTSLGRVLFEATSAACNTGLSRGVVSDLTPAGKANLIITMFIGRVSIFAILAAMASVAGHRRPRVEYPAERVSIY